MYKPGEEIYPCRAAFKRIVASCAPAVMWVAIGTPFDVVKTRLQTANVPFANPLHCLFWTVRREGLVALWKGFLPQLLLSSPYSMIMFGVYDLLKPKPMQQSAAGNAAGSFFAGAASGVAVTAVHNPLELWRVRVQTHLAAKDAVGKRRTNRSVLRGLQKNPWQLGRGASMTLLENVVGNGVFFSSNETLRRQLFGVGPSNEATTLRLSEEAFVGGLTGIIFQLVVYPADLVKARLMTHDTIQARHVAQKILREDGLKGFYRGASVMILRAGIINAAGWPAWRCAQQYFELQSP